MSNALGIHFSIVRVRLLFNTLQFDSISADVAPSTRIYTASPAEGNTSALINVQKTKHTHALFSNLEAAHTAYPFITKAMADSGQYEATQVAGPTIQSVINLVGIKPEETVAEFLQRMQSDQTNLTEYA